MHKPDGYTSVSPYLIVEGAARTIDVKDPGGTTWWIATRAE
jgi:hypothetical protein